MVLLLVVGSKAWGEEVTKTYTFSSKSWAATDESNTSANWTGSQDGNQFNTSASPLGVQVCTGQSVLTVTSPVSYTNVTKVVVNYSSSSKGVGSIAVAVGETTIATTDISKSQSKVDMTFTPTTPLTGSVVITPTVTTNSMAIVSVAVTYENTSSGDSSATLSSIALSGDQPTAFWKNSTFSSEGLVVTATFSDGDDKDVTSSATFSGYDMTTAGNQTVTVSYTYGGVTKTATYDIEVKTIANTAETAYTPEAAKAHVDAPNDSQTAYVYVKGIVSSIASSSVNSDGQISFYVSEDGSTDGKQFEFYKCYKGADSEPFTSLDEISVGDEVIGYGVMTTYGSIYEFAAGCYLVSQALVNTVSIADIVVANGETITPTVTTKPATYTISYSSNSDVVRVSDDGTTLTAAGTGQATITATVKANGYRDVTTTFIVIVTSDATLTEIDIEGNLTKTEYTIGDAISFDGLKVRGNYSDYSISYLTDVATLKLYSDYDCTNEVTTLTTAGTFAYFIKAAYEEQSYITPVNIKVNKKDVTITIADMKICLDDEAAISAETTPSDATLTYESSDKSVATVADGKVTAVAAGTATITATFAGNDEYNAATKDFTVTVSNTRKVTFDLTTNSPTSASETQLQWLNVNATMTADKGSASTETNSYYPGATDSNGKNYTSTRFYKNSTLTFDPATGVTIESIVATATTAAYALALQSSTWTNATATADGTTVTITPATGTSDVVATLGAAVGLSNVVVYYTGTPTIEVSSISISGSYPTSFNQGAEFSHDGAVVTATYTDNTTKDVTSSATFSGYDMSTLGTQTVTVSFTDGQEATTTYTITVNRDVTAGVALVATVEDGASYALATDLKATEVNVVNGKIIADASSTLAWFITEDNGSVTIQTSTDKYLTGGSSTTLSVGDASYSWTADTENNTWVSNSRSFIYQTSGAAFKNYSTSNAGKSGYSGYATAYTFSDGYTRTVTIDETVGYKWGTVCMPCAVKAADYTGATFYSVTGKAENGSYITVTEEEGDLVAGRPYIIKSTGNLVCAYTGDAVSEAGSNNGLHGVFAEADVPTGSYVVSNNMLLTDDGTFQNYVSANRAYVTLSDIQNVESGAKAIRLSIFEDEATGIQYIGGELDSNAPLYNLAGKRVSAATKGIIIQNGHKFINK